MSFLIFIVIFLTLLAGAQQYHAGIGAAAVPVAAFTGGLPIFNAGTLGSVIPGSPTLPFAGIPFTNTVPDPFRIFNPILGIWEVVSRALQGIPGIGGIYR